MMALSDTHSSHCCTALFLPSCRGPVQGPVCPLCAEISLEHLPRLLE